MTGSRHKLVGVAVVCLSLVAAACGGDDGGGGATEATVDEGVKKGVSDAVGGAQTTAGATASTAPAKQPSSMAEAEALWAEQRAAVVKKIKDNGWGLSADGKTLTG